MIMRTATVPRVLPGGRMDGVVPAQTRRYADGRTCAVEGCETRLSRYNPAEWCWVHETPRRFIARAERRNPTTEPEPQLVSIDELLPLVRGTDHHPEPGPEPAPAPTPPPPIPSAARTRR